MAIIVKGNASFNNLIRKTNPKKRASQKTELVSAEARALNIEALPVEPGAKFDGYFPNLLRTQEVLDENGEVILGEDGKPVMEEVFDVEYYVVHQLKSPKTGKFAGYVRCVNNLEYTDEHGNVVLDGECPVCKAMSQVEFKAANMRIEEECNRQNLNKDDKENEAVRAIRRAQYEKTLVGKQVEFVQVPFYEILTEPKGEDKTGKKTGYVWEKDENGNVVMLGEGKPKPVIHRYFKRLSLAKYMELCEEASDRDMDSIAGVLATIRYPEGTKMLAGKGMKINLKSRPSNPKTQYIFDYIDEDAKKYMKSEDVRRYFSEVMINTKAELQERMDRLTAGTVTAIEAMEASAKLGVEDTDSVNSELKEMGIDINDVEVE